MKIYKITDANEKLVNNDAIKKVGLILKTALLDLQKKFRVTENFLAQYFSLKMNLPVL
jgi:hypothetical protein